MHVEIIDREMQIDKEFERGKLRCGYWVEPLCILYSQMNTADPLLEDKRILRLMNRARNSIVNEVLPPLSN